MSRCPTKKIGFLNAARLQVGVLYARPKAPHAGPPKAISLNPPLRNLIFRPMREAYFPEAELISRLLEADLAPQKRVELAIQLHAEFLESEQLYSL